jgi:hypothetical protein
MIYNQIFGSSAGLPKPNRSGMKGQLPSRFRALRRHDFADGASRIGSNQPCRPAEVQILFRPDVILFRPSTDLPAPHRSRSKKTEHARGKCHLTFTTGSAARSAFNARPVARLPSNRAARVGTTAAQGICPSSAHLGRSGMREAPA